MTINGTTEQGRREPAGAGYRETRFDRRSWECITQSHEDRIPVTLWIGIKALVIAVTMPGIEPDGLRLSVRGTRLSLQGPAGIGSFSRDVDLPYPVEMPPIQIKDGKDTLYILLQRK
jgi:HSP20 family molecular chaperone IbpA